MVVRIRGGLDLYGDAAPRQSIEDGPAIGSVAVLGVDYANMRLDALAEPGTDVAAGQPLLRHRSLPERVIVAPVAGRVGAVTRGPRRSIAVVEIVAAGDRAADFEVPASLDRTSLVRLLQASGLWAAVRTRPFDNPAALADPAEALFITAMDTRPHAPDPALIIAGYADWFQRGAEALTVLSSGTTYLCHAEGAALPRPAGITEAVFAGRHPAGLASTHIHHLHPVGRGPRIVWQIGYQEVIALGHLLATGHVWTDRVVAVSGPALSAPALLRTRPGASLAELVRGRLAGDAATLASGSPLDARPQKYLSRGHLQVSASPDQLHAGAQSRLGQILRRWQQAGAPAIIPNAVHERAAPIGILPVPFLRALSIGDAETAGRLGALELVEEDLALLSHVDGSGADFGALLRSVLDDLEGVQ
jgi:Na+-transporting NADH:ubiquinone oxidoreductase subunit A